MTRKGRKTKQTTKNIEYVPKEIRNHINELPPSETWFCLFPDKQYSYK